MFLVIVLLCAFIADSIIGDPVYRLHPVRLIGNLIQLLERAFRKLHAVGIRSGIVLLLITVLISISLYGIIHFGLYQINPWVSLVWDIFILYSCVALRDMTKHAKPIASALRDENLPLARELLQNIVGRDTALLDQEGTARAAVESVAESFVDGFFAPVLWFVVAGIIAYLLKSDYMVAIAVSASLLYRTVNTLDSMVGYRNERYRRFGTASALTDDVLNFLPARLSLLILTPAAILCRLDVYAGWRIALRDRLKHSSPNSAHTESFVAGALGLKLGGPTIYAHGTVDKPWLGDGNEQTDSFDITKTCRVITYAGWLWVIIICVIGSIVL